MSSISNASAFSLYSTLYGVTGSASFPSGASREEDATTDATAAADSSASTGSASSPYARLVDVVEIQSIIDLMPNMLGLSSATSSSSGLYSAVQNSALLSSGVVSAITKAASRESAAADSTANATNSTGDSFSASSDRISASIFLGTLLDLFA